MRSLYLKKEEIKYSVMQNSISKENLYKISRLNKNYPNYNEIIKLHQQAIDEGNDIYIDPESGYAVLTAEFLLKRGYCCGSGCRHCPYDEKA